MNSPKGGEVMLESNNEEENDDYILKIEGIVKEFEIGAGLFGKGKQSLRAVDGINLEVAKDETLGIVGESGSGKSTVANLIMGLLEPTEGKIILNGEDIGSISKQEMRKKRADMQMIFQDPYTSLNPRMRIFNIIAEPLRTHHVAKGEQLKKEIYDLLDAVGLEASYATRFPHELSGGQRQRIGIARALALKPKLVVCDEPVSALDVSVQAQILNLLKKLQREYGLTYIFIGHGMPSVKHMSDRIAVMYLGKVVELTTKDKLFKSPMHPYTEGLLSAIPVPDPLKRKQDQCELISGDIPSLLNPPSGCSFHTRCPYAQEKCKMEMPEFRDVTDGHSVACHFPLNKLEKINA